MAAVIACGAGAALSHRSAAELWEMLGPMASVQSTVTVPSVSGRKPPRRHPHPPLALADTPRLTAQHAASRSRRPRTHARRPRQDALRRGFRPQGRPASRVHRPRRPGSRPTAPAVSSSAPSCASAAATGFRRRRSTPAIGRFTVDFLWPEQRLVVEADGYAAPPRPPGLRGRPRSRARARPVGLRLRRFSARPDRHSAGRRRRRSADRTRARWRL